MKWEDFSDLTMSMTGAALAKWAAVWVVALAVAGARAWVGPWAPSLFWAFWAMRLALTHAFSLAALNDCWWRARDEQPQTQRAELLMTRWGGLLLRFWRKPKMYGRKCSRKRAALLGA